MISVIKAKRLIELNVKALSVRKTDMCNSLGCILSENIISPVNLPPFNQSAMDGYALRFSDVVNKTKIKIIAEIAAGNKFHKKLISGQAIRIFTGAPVPIGADTVVMQEKAHLENGFLIVNDTLLTQGANIRKLGSQIKKDSIALKKNIVCTPGVIGYIAAMGVTTLNVISKPRISIIITGSELKKPGQKLNKGQIFESNSFALTAALNSIGEIVQNIYTVIDDELIISKTIKKALANSDLILITGGVSVGDYDFTEKTLRKIGVKNIFHKVKQKPGKPLFFGKYNETIIFGLPGNPAAVLSCFYEYVFPAIKLMGGHKKIFLPNIFLPVTSDYKKKQGLSHFLKGKIEGDNVKILEGQESYILSSFAVADCLIYLPEEKENILKGELVEVHKLPGI